MFDYHKGLVSALSTVLPTYYELNLTSGIETPCISYMETNNYVQNNGDTLGYSRITYQIKIWGTDISTLQKYAGQVDSAVRPIGFTRVASNELHDRQSAMIQKILTYECLALEDY